MGGWCSYLWERVWAQLLKSVLYPERVPRVIRKKVRISFEHTRSAAVHFRLRAKKIFRPSVRSAL